MSGTTRRIWGRGRTSFALLTSLVVLSSFFIVAGAQVASAAQCGQSGAGAGCHLAFRFENPAKSGSYTDTGPHEAGRETTPGAPPPDFIITNKDLAPVIDPDQGVLPVIVEVEDGLGRRDTTYAGQISVAISSGVGTLSGTTTASAANGWAQFTNLSIDTAGYFQLRATALTGTGIADGFSGTFRIQNSVCEPGETCTDSFQPPSFPTLMTASLSYGGTGTVALSVAIDGVDPLVGGSGLTSCSVPATPSTPAFTDPFFHAPAEWTVDEVRATSATTKLLVIRIDKAWRQLVLDKGVSSYRPCITALVQFTTWDSSPLTESAPGEFTGLAPNCSKTITYFCLAYVKSNKIGDVIEGISLPSGSIAGDPRGH